MGKVRWSLKFSMGVTLTLAGMLFAPVVTLDYWPLAIVVVSGWFLYLKSSEKKARWPANKDHFLKLWSPILFPVIAGTWWLAVGVVEVVSWFFSWFPSWLTFQVFSLIEWFLDGHMWIVHIAAFLLSYQILRWGYRRFCAVYRWWYRRVTDPILSSYKEEGKKWATNVAYLQDEIDKLTSHIGKLKRSVEWEKKEIESLPRHYVVEETVKTLVKVIVALKRDKRKGDKTIAECRRELEEVLERFVSDDDRRKVMFFDEEERLTLAAEKVQLGSSLQ